MVQSEIPSLDACGFIRVPGETPLWMTCEQCRKSDHFWVSDEAVRCRCGAVYDHAVRPDGVSFAVDALTFTPWRDGPLELADVEVHRGRLVAIVAVVAAGLVVAVWWWLG